MVKVLVYRFSAMGDVVLLLPALKGVLASNPEIEVYLLTPRSFFPFFEGIDRLFLIEADIRNKHKSFRGLFQLAKETKDNIRPNFVIDLHCVIRTFFLDVCFAILGCKVTWFKKGSVEKRVIIRYKKLKQLPSTVERYAEAFRKIGLNIQLPDTPLILGGALDVKYDWLFRSQFLVGIAPFAKHRQKIWGQHKVESLISLVNQHLDATIVLFGGGKEEIKILKEIAANASNCFVSSDYFDFQTELSLFPKLSVMVSMDSANMHLASMSGTPTLSIWGATHPSLGFSPYMQPENNMIQYSGDELTCRPCSVYGNKKCKFSENIRCMELISPETVYKRLVEVLNASTKERN
jgi:ADP-heptose:LPS heptosyltransferase